MEEPCARYVPPPRRGGGSSDETVYELPDREKAKSADFVYVNTGTPEELDTWVAGVMATLTEQVE